MTPGDRTVVLPVVAIVGRPNVGKSTLFNRLTASRDALVAAEPGVTRDRQYAVARRHGSPCIVIDTGGADRADDPVTQAVAAQRLEAEREADVCLLVVDAREGLTPADEALATHLRRSGKPVVLAVNKTDGLDATLAIGEFHALGFEDVCAIAASHGRGLAELMRALARHFPAASALEEPIDAGVRVAVVGRPNVGKSTLVNRVIGAERVITDAEPGTTRDSIRIPFTRDGRRYTLIDTAGLRRRSRVDERVERLSAVKTLQALEACDVAVVLLDASEPGTDQDARLLGLAVDAGRALVAGVNKWDRVPPAERARVRALVERRLGFVDFAPVHYLSALEGHGLGALMRSIERVWRSASRHLPTPLLTRMLGEALSRHAPPLVRGRRIRLRYAHQGGANPPVIVIHGNQTEAVPDAYRRYLAREFRRRLGLEGAPLRLEFRSGRNPYA